MHVCITMSRTIMVEIFHQHIIDSLEGLGWTVETDDFVDTIPEVDDVMQGTLNFSNVIGTFNPDAARNLVLGCHYESKYFSATSEFIGATDSAVSCAIIIDLAASLTPFLQQQQVTTKIFEGIPEVGKKEQNPES